MASLIFSIVLFPMWAQFPVFSAGMRLGSRQDDLPPIQLSEMLNEFRRLDQREVATHLQFMLWVASYGDRLYRLPVELSANCRRTAAAYSAMQAQLAFCEEAHLATSAAIQEAARDLQRRAQSLEHPLESVCRSVEKQYGRNSTLRQFFEKAQKEAVVDTVAPRRPYLDVLVEAEGLTLEVYKRCDNPQLAKILVTSSFGILLNAHAQSAHRKGRFVGACRDMAKEERFADSMQKIFAQTTGDVVSEIMAIDRVREYKAATDSGRVPFQWLPRMVQRFRDYVAKDAILKREADDRVATAV